MPRDVPFFQGFLDYIWQSRKLHRGVYGQVPSAIYNREPGPYCISEVSYMRRGHFERGVNKLPPPARRAVAQRAGSRHGELEPRHRSAAAAAAPTVTRSAAPAPTCAPAAHRALHAPPANITVCILYKGCSVAACLACIVCW